MSERPQTVRPEANASDDQAPRQTSDDKRDELIHAAQAEARAAVAAKWAKAARVEIERARLAEARIISDTARRDAEIANTALALTQKELERAKVELTTVRTELEDKNVALGRLRIDLEKANAELKSSRTALLVAERRCAAIANSTIWRASLPLRIIIDRIRPFSMVVRALLNRGFVGVVVSTHHLLRTRGLRGTVELIFAKFSGRKPPVRLDPGTEVVLIDPRATAGRVPMAPARSFGEKLVLAGELQLPQCRKYRVTQKQEMLDRVFNSELAISDFRDSVRSLTLMQTASKLVLYRVPKGPEFDQIIREARRLSLEVCYDIDDPMFDLEIVKTNPNLIYLSEDIQQALFRDAVVLHQAMLECDRITVSTAGLRDLVRRNFRDIPCHVIPNGVDAETAHFGALARTQHDHHLTPKFTILLASGSLAHAADVSVAIDGVNQFLERYPNAQLITIGHFNAQPWHDRTAVKQLPYMAYSEYMRILGTVDCTLVPLVEGPFNDCKSIVRLIDATEARVPVIASPVGEYADSSLTSAYIAASSTADWFRALETLANDRESTTHLLKEAQRNVREKRVLSALCESLDPQLQEFFGRQLTATAAT